MSLEIKARCVDPGGVRAILRKHKAGFRGLDHQIDTYFSVPSGRLKLREGNIENALIFYKRADRKRSKRCDSVLYPCAHGKVLKKILAVTLGVLTVVDKKREIYFLGNAKIHVDRVKRLGSFVEIEVFGPARAAAKLRSQCERCQKLLGIRREDLVADSYSDQLLRLKKGLGTRPSGLGKCF